MSRAGASSYLQLVVSEGALDTKRPPARRTGPAGRIQPVAQILSQPPVSTPIRRQEAPSQGWLFPDPDLMGLVDMSGTRESMFRGLLLLVRPRWLMDLRDVPRFDYGSMNRRIFFEFCEQLGIRYRDVAGLVPKAAQGDASLSSGLMATIVNDLLSDDPALGSLGPVLFLLENAKRVAVADQVLPLLVQPWPALGWKVCTWSVR